MFLPTSTSHTFSRWSVAKWDNMDMISVCIIKSFLISVSLCVPEIRVLIMSMYGNIGDNTDTPHLCSHRDQPSHPLIHFTTLRTITDANDRKWKLENSYLIWCQTFQFRGSSCLILTTDRLRRRLTRKLPMLTRVANKCPSPTLRKLLRADRETRHKLPTIARSHRWYGI